MGLSPEKLHDLRGEDPAAIKWGESGAEYVCESTGAENVCREKTP